MKIFKKTLCLFLCLCLIIFNFFVTVNAESADITIQENNCSNIMDIEEYTNSFENKVVVNIENLSTYINTYDIPEEVAEGLQKRLNEAKSDTVISLLVPSNIITAGVNSENWSPIRTYKGYQLQDWVITISNECGFADVNTSTAGSDNFFSFVGTAFVYISGILADKIQTFGSAVITACEYLFGLKTDMITPSHGDKLQANPSYICYDTYTYVITSEGRVMGCHTYSTYLRSVKWYAYYAKEDTPQYKTATIATFYNSSCYNDRNETAIQWYQLGGYGDSPVSVTIGSKNFILN